MVAFLPLQICSFQVMSDMGWVAEIMLLQGTEYGAVTRRKRAWLVCLQCARCGVTPAVGRALLKKIVAMVAQLTLDPLPLECFLLDDDDPYLKREVQELKCEGRPSDDATRWQGEVVKSLEKRGLSWSDLKLQPSLLESPWIQGLSERSKAFIAQKELHPLHTMRIFIRHCFKGRLLFEVLVDVIRTCF